MFEANAMTAGSGPDSVAAQALTLPATVREQLDAGHPVDRIADQWQGALAEFDALRRNYWLYE